MGAGNGLDGLVVPGTDGRVFPAVRDSADFLPEGAIPTGAAQALFLSLLLMSIADQQVTGL